MISVFRTLPWLSCAACCALAGCGLVPKSRNACSHCGPSAIAEVPSTYENYTPVVKPLPAPAAELPPSPGDDTLPPPPSTRVVPDSRFDFFEPSNADRSQSNTR